MGLYAWLNQKCPQSHIDFRMDIFNFFNVWSSLLVAKRFTEINTVTYERMSEINSFLARENGFWVSCIKSWRNSSLAIATSSLLVSSSLISWPLCKAASREKYPLIVCTSSHSGFVNFSSLRSSATSAGFALGWPPLVPSLNSRVRYCLTGGELLTLVFYLLRAHPGDASSCSAA